MSPSIVDVVVRCRNEMPHTKPMLESLLRQRGVSPRVLFMDCDSTDGSRELAASFGVRILDVDPKRYIPGAVLNRAMEETTSELVAFVNADAIPLEESSLDRLLAPLWGRERIAAVYARQLPRPDADPLVKLEYGRAFGDAPMPVRRGVFFSMASSAIRRSVWETLRFDESLRYSEDVDWTHRVRALGFEVAYAPDARFEHSHDYTPGEQYRRRVGEGRADRAIHRLGRPSVLGDFVRPLAGALARDYRAGLLDLRAVETRAAQALGYFAGRWNAY